MAWELILLAELGPLIPDQPEIVKKQKPDISIQGAYTKEKAESSLTELFLLVDAFPEKLFIVALGNYGDDIRTAREALADVWPKNIIFVGEWNHFVQAPTAKGGYTHGADIFVDHKTLNIGKVGSSISTAVISAKAVTLKHSGITSPRDIKGALLTQGVLTEYEAPTTTPQEAWIKEIILGIEKPSTEKISARVLAE